MTVKFRNDQTIEVDIAIVGAGSAGCALAGRLAATTRYNLALIEAGERPRSIWFAIPAGYYRVAFDPRFTWRFQTTPQARLGGRSLLWPRGRVVGGSSAINGLVYVRGQAEDFDGWRRDGCVGWGYDDVLPAFRRCEDYFRGADEFHGSDGPIGVNRLPMTHPLLDRFVAAAENHGLPLNDDFNGRTQEGVGYFHLTTRTGRRCSGARGCLPEMLAAGRVRLVTGARIDRITFESGRAHAAEGERNGQPLRIKARAAVVLAAGAIGTPLILQRSGVGDGDMLRRLGLPVATHRPEVGRNLHDHYQVKVVAEIRSIRTYNEIFHSPLLKLGAALDYALRRSGPLAASGGQVGVFARALPDAASPDVQFHVSPQSTIDPSQGLDRFPGFTVGVCGLRPTARGTIQLGGAEPAAPPVIDPRYLETEEDRRTLIAGLRLALAILTRSPMAEAVVRIVGDLSRYSSDDTLLAYSTATGSSVYHPAGACRMGADLGSVVDPRLRVRGVEGLRVADASILPSPISGNTNAACIMIGERAAELLRDDLAS